MAEEHEEDEGRGAEPEYEELVEHGFEEGFDTHGEALFEAFVLLCDMGYELGGSESVVCKTTLLRSLGSVELREKIVLAKLEAS